MLVISEYTAKKLPQKIEAIREAGEVTRCLCVSLARTPLQNAYKTLLVKHMAGLATRKNTTLFQCPSGDLYLFDPAITQRAIEAMLSEGPFEKARNGLMQCMQIYECPYDLTPLEERVSKTLQGEAEEKKRAESIETQKRLAEIEAILNSQQVDDLLKRRSIRKRPEMLIVEDDHFTQRLIAKTVDPRIHVTFADNAKDALLHYITLAPDMVLLDIGLPDINGHEVMRHILAVDGDAYVVMLSGNADTHNVIRSVENGAQGFIGKPFNRTKLSAYTHKSPFIQSKLTGGHS